MDGEDDGLDTHICLSCKETIVGLDEYVHHKKNTCTALIKNKLVISSRSTSDETIEEIVIDPVTETSGEVQPQSDDFFHSLELQSKKSKDVPAIHSLDDTSTENHDDDCSGCADEKQHSVSHVNFGEAFETVNTYYVVDAINIDESTKVCLFKDEEMNEVHPPSSHTGGKWKPASPGITELDGNCAKNTDDTTATESIVTASVMEYPIEINSLYCCGPCGLKMQYEEDLIQHLSTPSHWNRSRSHPEHEAMVLKYSSKLASNAPYCCALCQFYFNRLEYLIQHWDDDECDHHKDVIQGGYLCSACGLCFASPKKIAKHLQEPVHRDATSENPLVISVIKGKGSLRCALCPYVARTGKSFSAHMRWKHQGECSPVVPSAPSSVTRSCRYCEFVATSAVALKEHVAMQHPNKLLHCAVCPEVFVYPVVLSKHQEGHNKKSSRGLRLTGTNNNNNNKHSVCDTMPLGVLRFSCSSCTYHCETKAKLLFHETRHSKAVVQIKGEKADSSDDGSSRRRGVKLYQCPVCQKLLPRIMLYYHILDHTGEKPHKCTTCGASFARQSSLYSHDKALHGGKHLVCPQCPYKTFKKSKLERHIEIHSDNRPRPFLCDICGAKFLQSYSLKHHKKLHYGQKNHRCGFEGCDKSYRSWSELEVHVRTHTNERPFLCTACGYAAKTRHQLTKHERSHTGERPFKCPHCTYAAALSAQLWRHLRIHTGARPYSCPHCSYTCNTSENLRKHVLKSKKHQGLNVYVCPHCSFGCDLVKELQDHVVEKHKDTIGADQSISPTYISLLSGVYDRNASKGEVVVVKENDLVTRPPKKRTKRLGKLSSLNVSEEQQLQEELAAAEQHLMIVKQLAEEEEEEEEEAAAVINCEQRLMVDGEEGMLTSDEPMIATQAEEQYISSEEPINVDASAISGYEFLNDENIVSVQVIDDVNVITANGDFQCEDEAGNTFILPVSSLDNETLLSLNGDILAAASDDIKNEGNDSSNTILIYVPMC